MYLHLSVIYFISKFTLRKYLRIKLFISRSETFFFSLFPQYINTRTNLAFTIFYLTQLLLYISKLCKNIKQTICGILSTSISLPYPFLFFRPILILRFYFIFISYYFSFTFNPSRPISSFKHRNSVTRPRQLSPVSFQSRLCNSLRWWYGDAVIRHVCKNSK